MTRPSLTISGYSHKLNPTPPRLSVWVEPNASQVQCMLKCNSTPSLPYSGRVSNYNTNHILLNTNKQSMLILIRCDGTSSRIILFYYYKIISLPLLRCMKQVKPCNIKGSTSIQEKGSKPYTMKHKHITSSSTWILHLLSLSLLYFHKSSLIYLLMLFCYIKIPRTDLIFRGLPINTTKGL